MTSALRDYLRLLLVPWKVVSFAIGMAAFVIGALWFAVPTWDVGVSIWMSILCFALAPLAISLAVVGHRKHAGLRRAAYLIASAALIYFVGSGSYEIYHLVIFDQHPPTYWPNLFFSVPVAIIAGILWRYDGTLMDLFEEISGLLETTPDGNAAHDEV